MTTNSLLSAELWSFELKKMWEQERAKTLALEEQLQTFFDEHPGISRDDVYLELRNPFIEPRYTIRVKTPEQKWLEWQSDNHGWERSPSHDD